MCNYVVIVKRLGNNTIQLYWCSSILLCTSAALQYVCNHELCMAYFMADVGTFICVALCHDGKWSHRTIMQHHCRGSSCAFLSFPLSPRFRNLSQRNKLLAPRVSPLQNTSSNNMPVPPGSSPTFRPLWRRRGHTPGSSRET